MNPQLQTYIAEAKLAGKSEELIRSELQQAGWSEADLGQAFGTAPVSPQITPGIPLSTASVGPVAVAATGVSWVFPLLITIIIVVIITGGAYFFSERQGNIPASQQTVDIQSQEDTSEQVLVQPTFDDTELGETTSDTADLAPNESATLNIPPLADCASLLSGSELTSATGVSASSLILYEYGKPDSLACDYYVKPNSWSAGYTIDEKEAAETLRWVAGYTIKKITEENLAGMNYSHINFVSLGLATEVSGIGTWAFKLLDGGIFALSKSGNYAITSGVLNLNPNGEDTIPSPFGVNTEENLARMLSNKL
ncbi:MAG: hypothetical protein Q8P93_04375 [bacterium]|nr:hypothetical protein [bacterium]